jgi:endonuclease I
MYSDIPGGTPAYSYDFVVDQCGNYGGEGDCYNREHSFPKSWFNDAAPMVTDLFHIYPTDGYVNGMRSNYPFGEVGSATWTSTNGSKVGSCVFPGYSGIVFEPIDEYKGDFARSYFYMLTRYLDVASSWSSPMLSGGNFSSWAEDLLIQWHEADPVSDKEVDRNNEVHDIQSNRNPFIDHAEWVAAIWGTTTLTEETIVALPGIRYSEGKIYFENAYNQDGILILCNIYGQVLGRWDSGERVISLPGHLEGGIYFLSFFDNKQSGSIKFFLP